MSERERHDERMRGPNLPIAWLDLTRVTTEIVPEASILSSDFGNAVYYSEEKFLYLPSGSQQALYMPDDRRYFVVRHLPARPEFSFGRLTYHYGTGLEIVEENEEPVDLKITRQNAKFHWKSGKRGAIYVPGHHGTILWNMTTAEENPLESRNK